MERLYYKSSDFQNEVVDFAFDAYLDEDDDKAYLNRQ